MDVAKSGFADWNSLSLKLSISTHSSGKERQKLLRKSDPNPDSDRELLSLI